MSGVRALYDTAHGKASVQMPIKQQPYGDWEFEFRDLNGYVLVSAVENRPPRPSQATPQPKMPNSAYIARLLGPALIGITVTEWLNLDVFAAAIGPAYATHVYLNGTLLFVAGLAIVRAHNVWSRRWPVLITLAGWIGIVGGLGQMVAPVSAQQAGEKVSVLYGSLVLLFAIGVVLTFKGYRRENRSSAGRSE